MERSVPLSDAVNRLWLPRVSLASCVRAAFSRDTTGVHLPDRARYNYFPLTPLCSISWFFEGECHVQPFSAAPRGPAVAAPLSRIVVAGPFDRPSLSWNPGPGHGMMLMLMPDAFRALTGVQPADLVNRFADAHELLPEAWCRMCRDVLAAPDDDTRVALMEDFLDPLWQATRPETSAPGRRYHDWTQAIAMRAATSGLGRSARQVERRIKEWTGQPLRSLRGISRAERAFLDGLAAPQHQAVNMAELAVESGYADQSHMCRESKRITGFAPDELRRRTRDDEAFWVYRIWQ